MATSNLGPFVDVRSVITLARREGERLAELTRDVQALVFTRPADLAAGVGKLERDVRTRADAAVKGLGAGGALVIGAVGRPPPKAPPPAPPPFSPPPPAHVQPPPAPPPLLP